MTEKRQRIERIIDQGMGRMEADLVLKNGRFLNVVTGEIATGDIAICGDRIVGTYDAYRGRREIDLKGRIAVPGFIDCHLHVESSLVAPAEFDRCVLPRGTTTAICDPHELSNVLGVAGLQFFLDSAEQTAMDLRVQLSSCVPATHLETAGGRLDAADLLPFRDHPKTLGLAEFMNVPGLLHKDPKVLDKIEAFWDAHIDGHAPLLGGHALNAYLACGIRNCHETTNTDEAWEKLRKGMQVFIREGSACKDLHALHSIISTTTAPFLGFCTDDRNPLDIAEEGHIDHLIREAIRLGAKPADVYRLASWSAARSFGLRDRGLIAPGQRADIVLLDDLESCAIHAVISAGRLVDDELFGARRMPEAIGRNSIKLAPVEADLFRSPAGGPSGPVIGLREGQVLTDFLTLSLPYRDGERMPDIANDVLKVCVIERHGRSARVQSGSVNGIGSVGRGFVKGLKLPRGAMASSIGHDSHNICVVGASDADMAVAVNRLIELGGGFAAAESGRIVTEMPLPLGGLMSDRNFETVAQQIRGLRQGIRDLGCPLAEPFLQMAFLPLPVIPHLKITDKGLVDVDRFELIAA
ncbi:adenine deaminase [Dongia soli]|uniref:Adenine deaminase n=1 Tax=Dongia soli TaxID=600628 RepID=A0ABU5E6X2_9PROT|nr:adenine deaminase [Dongia soli]MDY0881933.1 adenine deaminase [Dongia soli]